MNKAISIFGTYIDATAYRKIKDTLDSTFLSEGKIVQEFEKNLHEKLGWLYPVAVNSGTSALHLSLATLGIGKGDEVIVPPQTFISTALAPLYLGAKPIFADIQYSTGNIDPISVKDQITKKTKAIIVVHWGGYPCDMDEIAQIAQEYKLPVIEDAAHALGAEYNRRPIGSISSSTCFSFQAIKHLTTGDGGAVCWKSKLLYQRACKLRWFGIDRVKDKASLLGERQYNLKEVGYKYHMNDYEASLGLANLNSIRQRIERRRKIAQKYREELGTIDGIGLFDYKANRKSSYWAFGFHVEKRSDFIKALRNRKIQTSVIHQGIDRNDIFGGIQKNLYNQRHFDQTQIHIPIHDFLEDKDIHYIISSIKKGW